MKNRYGIIIVLSVVAIIISIYTWKSSGCCKKSHKEGIDNGPRTQKAIELGYEREEREEEKKEKEEETEGFSLFGIGKDKKNKPKKKESFDNYYHLSEGFNNLGVSVCSNCKQPNDKANWSCNECRPPPKHPMKNNAGPWTGANAASGGGAGVIPAAGRLPSQNTGTGNSAGAATNPWAGKNAALMKAQPTMGVNNAFKSRTENFDNMSTNFNNIMFSSPTSTDSISDFFKDVLFSTDCCPSSYSTDKGCACISPSQYNILKTRADNNIPYSEF